MSKYIRTENGIYEVIDVKYNEDIDMNQYFIENNEHFNEHEIIKQSDTIKELCDEFVTAYIDGFHQLTSFPSKIEVILGHSVYGAIWTDKGLIYVAKLNNDGVLKLI